MAAGTLSYSIGGTVDGIAKSITGSVALDVTAVSEGSFNVTSTYDDMFGPSFTNFITVLFYNTGDNDLSIRVNVGATTRYYFYTVPPGQVFVLPERYATASGNTPANSPTTIGVRSASATGSFDYCVIR